jgi:hypothetical protein
VEAAPVAVLRPAVEVASVVVLALLSPLPLIHGPGESAMEVSRQRPIPVVPGRGTPGRPPPAARRHFNDELRPPPQPRRKGARSRWGEVWRRRRRSAVKTLWMKREEERR